MRILSSQIPGLGLGKRQLVPTINLVIPKNTSFPYGIYAAYATLNIEGVPQKYRAVVHYGPRPVLRDASLSFEVHILSPKALPQYDKDHIAVDMIKKLRDIGLFNSLSDLKRQIEKDILSAHVVFDTLS